MGTLLEDLSDLESPKNFRSVMGNIRGPLYWNPETLRQHCQTRTSSILIITSFRLLSSPIYFAGQATACKGDGRLFKKPLTSGINKLACPGPHSVSMKYWLSWRPSWYY